MLPMKLFIYGKNFTYMALANLNYDATNVKNVVKNCACTHLVHFRWPSHIFQPLAIAHSILCIQLWNIALYIMLHLA